MSLDILALSDGKPVETGGECPGRILPRRERRGYAQEESFGET